MMMMMTSAMGSATRLVLLLATFASFAQSQRTFYENKGYANYDAGPVQVVSRNFDQRIAPSKSADIDTDGIIAPFMAPIASLFDMYTQNKKALEYADKVEKERKSSLFDPDSILRALNLQTEPPPTEPPSFMEKLLEPIVGPIKHELSKVNPSTPKPSFLEGLLANPAAPIVNSDSARRKQPVLPISSSFLGPEVMSQPLFPNILPKSLSLPVLDASSFAKDPHAKPKTLDELIPAQLKAKPEPENDLFGLPKIQPIELTDNLFTANPFMGIFTTAKPIIIKEVKTPEIKAPIPKVSDIPALHQPLFPLQDPFYNPLLPNRKSKLFDFLTGGQANSLANLLTSFGAGAPQREQVEVARDRTVSILGMPIGRRDGLNLNPSKGMSYGNQNLYGPVAVNDKYNINWGFLDKIGSLVRESTRQFGGTTLAKLAAENHKKY